jgi:drug/metabolite transporter (DMT)-like permease
LKSPRLIALIEGILVTIIWASSFVIIKMGLFHLKPITLAGLRYFTAFLFLLPVMAWRGELKCNLTGGQWIHLFLMGLLAYTLCNGALFWGLTRLPAVTGSFLFSLLPVPVFFLGIFWLREKPKGWQIAGLILALVGGATFFSPGLSLGQPVAVVVVSLGILAFALYGTLSRKLAKDGSIGIVQLTAFPLGFGGGLLLLFGFIAEGPFQFSAPGMAIVLWLAIIHTALAYLLYYHSLRVLTALELHVLLILFPFWTALLAGMILREHLTATQIAGMLVGVVGVSLVQWKR